VTASQTRSLSGDVQVRDPVCVVVFREPLSNAISLAENAKKSDGATRKDRMTVKRWLTAWEEGACARALQQLQLRSFPE
jgi:hypothetical protein